MSLVPTAGGMWTDDRIELVKRTIAQGSTNDELALFLQVCERTGLDPFARQIYMVKRWDGRAGRDVASIQVGIDGFRLVAQRTGQYAGQDPLEWCGPDRVWRDVWSDETERPFAARAGVYRIGFVKPLIRVALWSEAAQYSGREQKLTATWARMPSLMLAKVAEAAALRAAFPAELSGLYTEEEMGGGEQPATPRPSPPPAPAELELVDDDGHAVLRPENVERFVAYCRSNELDPAEVVRVGTAGRTDDMHRVRLSEMTAVSNTAKAMVAEEQASRDSDGYLRARGAVTDTRDETDGSTVATAPVEPEAAGAGEGSPVAPAPADTYTEEVVVPPRVRAISKAQVGKIKAEYDRLEIGDRKIQLAWTKDLLGLDAEPSSHNDLTVEQGSLLIELLVDAESIEALDQLVPMQP